MAVLVALPWRLAFLCLCVPSTAIRSGVGAPDAIRSDTADGARQTPTAAERSGGAVRPRLLDAIPPALVRKVEQRIAEAGGSCPLSAERGKFPQALLFSLGDEDNVSVSSCSGAGGSGPENCAYDAQLSAWLKTNMGLLRGADIDDESLCEAVAQTTGAFRAAMKRPIQASSLAAVSASALADPNGTESRPAPWSPWERRTCSLCSGNIRNRGTLPCGHQFCRRCARSWLRGNDDCPDCGVVVRPVRNMIRRWFRRWGSAFEAVLVGFLVIRHFELFVYVEGQMTAAENISALIYFVMTLAMLSMEMCTRVLPLPRYLTIWPAQD
mmetsp:Transcript_5084/g.14486  ORF Transcript_5084/g.14486 Transcript_5084/m.14486 type:complete len:325 (+) Transcript_5084:71-1045(+)